MSKLVASGATLRCSMGMAPSSLLVVRAFTVDGAAALTTSSACDCQWAGKITVADPSNTLADDA